MADTPENQEICRNGKGQWAEGQSGNPKGREKGSLSLTGLLKRHLQEKAESVPAIVKVAKQFGLPINAETTVAEICMAAACFHASAGNGKLLEMLIDRVDGKQVIPSHHTVDGKLSTGDFISGYVNGSEQGEEGADDNGE